MICITHRLPPMPLNIASVRIQSLFAAYGTKYPFLTFWQQTNAGQATACLCRFYGHFTLWAKPSADFAELLEFLSVLGGGQIFCSRAAAVKMGFLDATPCVGLKCEARFLPPQETALPPLQQVYDLLLSGADGPIQLPPFADWYPDLSHRLRHGCARVVATPQSVALAGFESKNAAIITGVAVPPSARGQGLGRQAVAWLCGALQAQNKQIFVYTTADVAPFYTKLGFVAEDFYAVVNK